MIKIENFEKEFEELISLNNYINNKIQKITILAIILEVIFWTAFIYFATIEQEVVIILFGILATAGIMLFAIPTDMRAKYLRTNFQDRIIKFLNENTSYRLIKKENKNQIKEDFKSDTNNSFKNFTKSFDLAFSVYDDKDLMTPLFSYYYGHFQYGKNISYNGSIITYKNKLINGDCKILYCTTEVLCENYKKDKEISAEKKYSYFYNKKNITDFNQKFDVIFNEIEQVVNKDNNEDFISHGMFIKDDYCSILVESSKKKYSTKRVKHLSKENLEYFLNDLYELFTMMKKINKAIEGEEYETL